MLIDLFVLIFILISTAFALYKKRSRGMIWALSLFSLLYFGFFRKGCLCAVGTIQNMTDSLSMGEIPTGFVAVLFLIPIITALIAGRLFCGTACPLGAIQDFISLDRFKIPKFLDRFFVLLPPAILYLIVVAVVRGDGYILCRLDPFVSIFRMNAPLIPLIITLVAVLITFFIARPFCRYLCPYGVLLGLSSLLSKWRVDVEPDSSCRSCTLCEPACPVNVITQGGADGEKTDKLWLLIFGIIVLVAGSFYLGGEYAVLTRWFFEKEVITVTPDLALRLKITGRFMGTLAGIAWSLELFTAMRPTPKGYAPLVHRCISCGRCYNHCPGEVKRVRKMGVSK